MTFVTKSGTDWSGNVHWVSESPVPLVAPGHLCNDISNRKVRRVSLCHCPLIATGDFCDEISNRKVRGVSPSHEYCCRWLLSWNLQQKGQGSFTKSRVLLQVTFVMKSPTERSGEFHEVAVFLLTSGDWHCAYVLLYSPRSLELEADS